MLEKLISFIQSHQLLDKKDKIAIAVSGGRDSVAACYMLEELEIPFSIIHCNFNLRDLESDEDEQFVRSLAHTLHFALGIEVKQFHYDENEGLSIQEWARRMRYAWFQELFEQGLFDKLILAHHKDDERETFFINLVRGSGVNGLKSIPVKRDYIVRPLMAFVRREIDAYVVERSIQFREDSSNSENKYLRNKIRNLLMPSLDAAVPELRSGLDKSLEILKQEHELYNHLLQEISVKCIRENAESADIEIDRGLLGTYPQGHLILYSILDKYGFTLSQCVDFLTHEHAGAMFHSSEYELLRDREKGILRRKPDLETKAVPIIGEGTYELGQFKVQITRTKQREIPADRFMECIQLGDELFPLDLRFRRREDRIVPLGMTGSKLLSDYFIDRKISSFDKDRIPLICKGNQVLLVGGYGISEEVKLKSDSTNLYLIRVSNSLL